MDEQQKQMAEELFFAGDKQLSFAKRLFFGAFESSLCFPYPGASSEEKAQDTTFLEALQQFVDNEIDPDLIDRQAEIPSKVIQGLASLGVLGMTVPKEYGGLEMSQRAYCQAAEMIAANCSSTALFVNAHQSIGLKALLLFGTPEQKEKWLAPLARGEKLAAFSLTEPNAGSDAAGIETRAVFDKENNQYLITGKKQWTTNGSLADVLTVMAKVEVDTPTGKQDKVTAFLVTPDMPGFKVTEAALEKVGMRGTKTANLSFTNMPVPENQLLGKVGEGLRVCLTVLDYGRTTFGATCTGVSKAVYKLATEHARTRYQFKRPLASFGLVKKKIARMAALIYAMEATTYLTAGLVDAGKEEMMLESAILKVFTSESAWDILYDAMQIYGGRSFFTDHPFERIMRDSRLNMIGEGSNEVMRAFIGAVGMRGVGVELQGVSNALRHPIANPSSFLSSFTPFIQRLLKPVVVVNSALLQLPANQLAKAIRAFGQAVIKLLVYYREEIVEKQLELERIADSAIALYTASAVISKLELTLQQDPFTIHSQDVQAGLLYCNMAMETVTLRLDSLFSKQDPLVEALSDQITGVKFPWQN